MGDRGPKRTTIQRERDLLQVAEMYLRAETQEAIAVAISENYPSFGITRQQIGYDIKKLIKRWLKSQLINIDEAKARELAKVDRLEREYWDAWERSKEDKETVTKEKIERVAAQPEDDKAGRADDKAGRAKVQMRSEGQVGNPAFLSGLQWCIERRCKLLGLDAPQKQEISGPEGSPIVATNTIIVREYVKENEGD